MYPLNLLPAFSIPLFNLFSGHSSSDTPYSVKAPPLTTDWTYTVGTDPWNENPRPQLIRKRWQSLNGIWSYRNASSLNDVFSPPSGHLGQAVMIPSCLESGLSGASSG